MRKKKNRTICALYVFFSLFFCLSFDLEILSTLVLIPVQSLTVAGPLEPEGTQSTESAQCFFSFLAFQWPNEAAQSKKIVDSNRLEAIASRLELQAL